MRPFTHHLLRSTLNGFSQIFVQRHQGSGFLILIAIGLSDHLLLYGALTGLLTGNATAWCRGYSRSDIEAGLYGYNAALLGLLISSLLGLSPLTILLTAAIAALSCPLQHYLLGCMRERHGLPGFTLPFVLIGWLLLALFGLTDSRDVPPLSEHALDGWGALGGMLRGIAQVILLSDPLAGLCLLAALLLADQRAALWALCGSGVGIYAALLVGADAQALAGLTGYNPALAGLALSQVHRSPQAPALGIGLAIITGLAFEQLGIPPLTMPFILACWAVALAARRSNQCQPHLQPNG